MCTYYYDLNSYNSGMFLYIFRVLRDLFKTLHWKRCSININGIHLSLAICRRHRHHGRDAVGPTADAEGLFCIGLRNLKRKY